jgi:hypothetical protein
LSSPDLPGGRGYLLPSITRIHLGEAMLVQRVLLPATWRESWTVLGDGGPVRPIERYLAYLTDIERSPNTVKACAHDLKDWFVFLAGQGLDWREVRLEDVAGFVAWLRRPPAARGGAVTVLPSAGHDCGESTVNRKLSALSAFYQHAARSGVDLSELLVTWQPAGRRGTAWRPFLHHVTKGQLRARRMVALKAARMTGRYAQLSDTTIRRHWEAARKVNINGQAVTLDPDGPLAEAAWASQRIGHATQALPNGYCGLPVVKACPHANA